MIWVIVAILLVVVLVGGYLGWRQADALAKADRHRDELYAEIRSNLEVWFQREEASRLGSALEPQPKESVQKINVPHRARNWADWQARRTLAMRNEDAQ